MQAVIPLENIFQIKSRFMQNLKIKFELFKDSKSNILNYIYNPFEKDNCINTSQNGIIKTPRQGAKRNMWSAML